MKNNTGGTGTCFCDSIFRQVGSRTPHLDPGLVWQAVRLLVAVKTKQAKQKSKTKNKTKKANQKTKTKKQNKSANQKSKPTRKPIKQNYASKTIKQNKKAKH